MNTALLIIDVQEALCSGEEACFDRQRILQTINDLGARTRAVGRTVILIQHEELEGALTYGAAGWQLTDDLLTAADDLRVRKTTPDAFYQTDLQPLLQARGIDRLVICGLQTDYCVNATVRQAHALGYDVVLAADAHSTVDNGSMTAEQIIANHNNRLGRLSSAVSRIDVVAAADIRL
ncbi:cysteine hydrolase family protein [Pseudomonas thivervalensis]|uniref:Cysteine hydrolase n=1 Tax=Pseudomonas thivervalensis TaxID=86265 RepID=A0A176NTL4_9PSED|nr:cysteine hydrolase family protein [Pseudomonas thivervalensis]AXA53064.1 cysteine hydrolase [Pseudomonas thivervalensis]AXA58781.1 cysteine hydrolase [Pseudomonas thivervalensis]OAB54522.1 isochorismatase [Pseudomonas thivervalensis]SDF30659.1 Nicotinamidase-related amidase [Pseudomonas thivervalensis]